MKENPGILKRHLSRGLEKDTMIEGKSHKATMTDTDKLAEKATQGPWKPIAISEGWHGVQPEHSTDGCLVALCSAPEMDNEANAKFIAACNPETILTLHAQHQKLVEAFNSTVEEALVLKDQNEKLVQALKTSLVVFIQVKNAELFTEEVGQALLRSTIDVVEEALRQCGEEGCGE